MPLKVLTLNVHKGFSVGNRRFILPELREAFRASGADLVFLQEVLGNHDIHKTHFEDWPHQSQAEYLADTVWPDHAYGKNAIYEEGDHGNAILSRYPIGKWENYDISSSRWERRGFLHACIPIEGIEHHLICLHLSLTHRARQTQLKVIQDFIGREIPSKAPLILAGDFNDWSLKAAQILERDLGLIDAFRQTQGSYARTFPSFFPILKLDRIYSRGLKIQSAQVLSREPWSVLSDHAAIMADFGEPL